MNNSINDIYFASKRTNDIFHDYFRGSAVLTKYENQAQSMEKITLQ